jgi:hypothetical protein
MHSDFERIGEKEGFLSHPDFEDPGWMKLFAGIVGA